MPNNDNNNNDFVKCCKCTAIQGRGKYIGIIFPIDKNTGNVYCPLCYQTKKENK